LKKDIISYISIDHRIRIRSSFIQSIPFISTIHKKCTDVLNLFIQFNLSNIAKIESYV